MKKYSYNNFLTKKSKTLNAKTADGKKASIEALSVSDFENYRKKCKKSHVDFAVIGKTKLKLLEKDPSGKTFTTKNTDAAFEFDKNFYEIRRDYKFCRTVAYIPVGENSFVAVVKLSPWFLLCFLLLLLILSFSFTTISSRMEVPTENPFVEKIDIPETESNLNDGIRYIMNTTAIIAKTDQGDTVQNLGFENHNKGTVMRMKIKKSETDENYIYDTGPIKYGEKLNTDWLHTYRGKETKMEYIEQGEYDTLAECYTYSVETNELIMQTNFRFKLIVEKTN